MQIIRDIEELRPALRSFRAADGGDGRDRVALVPTMGALHAGHMALVSEARKKADRVVATIFVNPMQFGAGEDLERYPRREQADAELLQVAGCDLLWLPSVADIYPPGFATTISIAGVSERWEGEARPGHFDGVATVVARLLLAVEPDIALFGEKDFQQLAVIRRMAADLGLRSRIESVPTVRDEDGLALSSRNTYLTPDERKGAAALPRALAEARRAILESRAVAEALSAARTAIQEGGASRIDYVALVDAETLEPVARPAGTMRLIAAATFGGTRLIDNIPVEMDSSEAG